MFFRWRPAHFGAEIYWMGIIDHVDIPRRRYDEAKQFAGEVTALKDKIKRLIMRPADGSRWVMELPPAKPD